MTTSANPVETPALLPPIYPPSAPARGAPKELISLDYAPLVRVARRGSPEGESAEAAEAREHHDPGRGLRHSGCASGRRQNGVGWNVIETERRAELDVWKWDRLGRIGVERHAEKLGRVRQIDNVEAGSASKWRGGGAVGVEGQTSGREDRLCFRWVTGSPVHPGSQAGRRSQSRRRRRSRRLRSRDCLPTPPMRKYLSC
jgi:hypothetical protein